MSISRSTKPRSWLVSSNGPGGGIVVFFFPCVCVCVGGLGGGVVVFPQPEQPVSERGGFVENMQMLPETADSSRRHLTINNQWDSTLSNVKEGEVHGRLGKPAVPVVLQDQTKLSVVGANHDTA